MKKNLCKNCEIELAKERWRIIISINLASCKRARHFKAKKPATRFVESKNPHMLDYPFRIRALLYLSCRVTGIRDVHLNSADVWHSANYKFRTARSFDHVSVWVVG